MQKYKPFFVILFLITSIIHSDKCRGMKLSERIKFYDKIFIGEVIEEIKNENKTNIFYSKGAKFLVKECLKGKCNDTTNIYNKGSKTSCFKFSKGEVYVVFSRNDTIMACTPTCLYEEFDSTKIDMIKNSE